MSGRGLGFSGGTLDKLESVPGYRADLSKDEFLEQLGSLGMVLTGQTMDLAPADGKLYALRDVTGTVQSIPLIASSIMSKKIAAGAQAILLDVKCGNGAFMQTLEEARKLARLMVSIGELSGRDVAALLSDMNQPLGVAVGNALEMKEAIMMLKGEGPADFAEHCLEVASQMLVLGKRAGEKLEAREMAQRAIDSGSAFDFLKKLIMAQGGDASYIDKPEKLPTAPIQHTLNASESGYIAQVHARMVGEAAVILGAGRRKKGDSIDQAVGVSVLVKVGEQVEKGQPSFVVHARDKDAQCEAEEKLHEAVKIQPDKVDPLPLFYGLVD
jgi:pyrimidine-nucleoside phosphorylase